jgi:uroporphyrinogen III methyltransferase/synthase
MSPDTPAAAVQWGTYPRQRTVVATLTTLHDAVEREGLGAPVITVIGKVVALRDEIGWFDRQPLFGKRIVVTRASSQAGTLRRALASLGLDASPISEIWALFDRDQHHGIPTAFARLAGSWALCWRFPGRVANPRRRRRRLGQATVRPCRRRPGQAITV